MNKFRASFSVLNVWASGDWERAVKMYFKLEKFTTPAMADGKEFHEKWRKHTTETKTLPFEFGAKKLTSPICEQKIVVPIYDWLDLVGIIDCYDDPIIYEYKTGKTSSEDYAGTMQPGVYGVLATYAKMYVEQCQIMHYDQYQKKSDTSIVWLTDKRLEDSYNWIVTLSGEMHNYFIQNSLYEMFIGNI